MLQERLLEACQRLSDDDVRALISCGADVNFRSTLLNGSVLSSITPFGTVISAALTSRESADAHQSALLRVAQLLLDNGVVLGEAEGEYLGTVVRTENVELLDILLARGVHLDLYAFPLVADALAGRSTVMLGALAKRGVDLNVRNGSGGSPMHSWMYSRSASALARDPLGPEVSLRAFRDAGIDLDARDRIGATPLMRAIVANNFPIARALVIVGADLGLALRNGVGAVHLAAACAGSDFLRFLQDQGADLSALVRLRARSLQPDVRAVIKSILSALPDRPDADSVSLGVVYE